MRDKNIYRITYANGRIKYGNRHVLGCVMGSNGIYSNTHPVKVERAPEPDWEDVTAEFIKAKESNGS